MKTSKTSPKQGKTAEKNYISTSKCSAQHLFAGQNIQQISCVFYIKKINQYVVCEELLQRFQQKF